MPQIPESATRQEDIAFMQLALDQASLAAAAGEIPVGAVVVKDGAVLGVGRNSSIQNSDPSAHAEIVALRAAACALGNYRLDDCTLYVTLEPCAMCCGGIMHSRIKRVVFAALDPKTGCAGSVLNLFAQPQLNHQTQVEGGVLAEQAATLLQEFFKIKRDLKRSALLPLREDALRTPDRRFEQVSDFPWSPRYVCDLPSLAGLRMHYIDEACTNSAGVYLCLHPVPGWGVCFARHIPEWIAQGARVVVPDLIGFGKSDKPKRESVHSLAFHARCVLELVDWLQLQNVTLVVPGVDHALAKTLTAQAQAHFVDTRLQEMVEAHPSLRVALDAPYPDAGHRAAERAFASKDFR